MNKYQKVCEEYKKPKQILLNAEMVRAILDGRKTQTRRLQKEPKEFWYWYQQILYVRENWRIGGWNEHKQAIAVDYQADDYIREEWIEIEDEERFERYWAQCTEDAEKAGAETNMGGRYEWYPGDSPCRWRPSIHMPKEVARIFLKVTNVRVERLQDISNRDIRAEGVCDFGCTAHRANFQAVWNKIYAEKGYGWEENPWVWVIEFEVMDI